MWPDENFQTVDNFKFDSFPTSVFDSSDTAATCQRLQFLIY